MRNRGRKVLVEGFPGSWYGKESTCSAGDLGSIPGSRRSPGEGKGYSLQCSGLGNSVDCTVHEVANSRILSSFHFQSLPTGNFHQPLIFICQRADRMKTKITENESNWSHGPQPCLTQWNYEPYRVGPPKMDGSWWRFLSRCGPLEKGILFQYSCLENPINSMKWQKDRTLKDELPKWVGAQYATGEEWRNNSRKNEEKEPKRKQCCFGWTGDGSKVRCCKEQYCIGTWNVRSMNQGKLEVKLDRKIEHLH